MKTDSLTRKGIILLIIVVMILRVGTLNEDDLIHRSPFYLMSHPLEIFKFGEDANGGYTVTPGNVPHMEGEIVDSSGADKEITFWELPLWIQLSVISEPVFATVTVLLPFLIGKILSGNRNTKMEDIASYIAENPGCLESEISKDLDMKRGTLRYYLSRLSSDNRIQALKKGKLKGFFHVGHSKTNEQKVLDLHKKNENRKRIIEIIAQRPGVTGKELSSTLNIDKSTVHWHIKALEKDKLIDFRKNGRCKMYYPQASLLSDDD